MRRRVFTGTVGFALGAVALATIMGQLRAEDGGSAQYLVAGIVTVFGAVGLVAAAAFGTEGRDPLFAWLAGIGVLLALMVPLLIVSFPF